MNSYLDSSALAKLYVQERGTEFVRNLFISDEENLLFSAKITRIEVASALARKKREGDITEKEYESALEDLEADYEFSLSILDLTDVILDLAFSLIKRIPLKGYDAIQLASALHLNTEVLAEGDLPVVFICADDSLCNAAISEGLETINPNVPVDNSATD